MKKILLCFLCLILFANSALAEWIKIDDNLYIDNARTKIKGNYLYTKIKVDNANYINSILSEASPGIMVDSKLIGYMTVDVQVDSKNPRIKTSLTMLYDKNGNIVNKIKDNTWDYDISKSEWGAYCDIYDYLKSLK